MHRLPDGDEAFFIALVVFVLAVRDHARGRGDRQERLLDVHAFQCGLEVIDVALQLRLPGIGDRTDANRVGAGRDLLVLVELGVEFREVLTIGAALERIGAGLHRTALEAAEALEHVLRPADRFPELAVADHVDAGRGLPPHDVRNGVAQAPVVGAMVERLARLLRAQELLQRLRPDQAADVGGQNAFGAALHWARS
jgi:hypothetical protein